MDVFTTASLAVTAVVCGAAGGLAVWRENRARSYFYRAQMAHRKGDWIGLLFAVRHSMQMASVGNSKRRFSIAGKVLQLFGQMIVELGLDAPFRLMLLRQSLVQGAAGVTHDRSHLAWAIDWLNRSEILIRERRDRDDVAIAVHQSLEHAASELLRGTLDVREERVGFSEVRPVDLDFHKSARLMLKE